MVNHEASARSSLDGGSPPSVPGHRVFVRVRGHQRWFQMFTVDVEVDGLVYEVPADGWMIRSELGGKARLAINCARVVYEATRGL